MQKVGVNNRLLKYHMVAMMGTRHAFGDGKEQRVMMTDG
jgi:hypothetical protein